MQPIQKKILFFACLILIIGLMAIDFINPSLPYIMKQLNVSQSATKGLMVVYLLALGSAQFFYGSYADAKGRRNAIFLAFTIMILGFIVSALSVNLEMLYVGRFLTGLGTAGCPVITRALIADVFIDQAQLRQAFSYFAMSSQISPAIAPILGGVVQHYLGWHWVFWVLVAVNVILLIFLVWRMPEHYIKPTVPAALKTQASRYIDLLHNRHFILLSLQSSLILTVTLGYYSLSPFIFNHLGYTPVQNGLFYSFYAVGLVLGAFCLNTLLKRYDSQKLFSWLLLAYFIVFLAYTLIFYFSQAAYWIASFSFLVAFLCGIAAPLTLALCMSGFVANKGTASAMQSFIRWSFSGVPLLVVNSVTLTHFMQLAIFFIGISVAMIGLRYWISLR